MNMMSCVYHNQSNKVFLGTCSWLQVVNMCITSLSYLHINREYIEKPTTYDYLSLTNCMGFQKKGGWLSRDSSMFFLKKTFPIINIFILFSQEFYCLYTQKFKAKTNDQTWLYRYIFSHMLLLLLCFLISELVSCS